MTREYKGLKEEIAALKSDIKYFKQKNDELLNIISQVSGILGCNSNREDIMQELRTIIIESSYAQGERKQMARDLTSKDRLLRIINKDPIIEAEAEMFTNNSVDEMGKKMFHSTVRGIYEL